jgi:hypothetical protein
VGQGREVCGYETGVIGPAAEKFHNLLFSESRALGLALWLVSTERVHCEAAAPAMSEMGSKFAARGSQQHGRIARVGES